MVYLKTEKTVIMSFYKILFPPVSHKEIHMHSCAHIKHKKNYAELVFKTFVFPHTIWFYCVFSEHNQMQGILFFLLYKLNLCKIYISNR